jgi:hypothetical protein
MTPGEKNAVTFAFTDSPRKPFHTPSISYRSSVSTADADSSTFGKAFHGEL